MVGARRAAHIAEASVFTGRWAQSRRARSTYKVPNQYLTRCLAIVESGCFTGRMLVT